MSQLLGTVARSLALAVVLCAGSHAQAGAQANSRRAPSPGAQASSASAAQPVWAEAPPRCNAGLRLVGSVMNARHPERSKAAVRNKNGTRVMGPGQRIDNLTLLDVQATGAILLTAQGEACYMPVYLPAAERPAVAPQRRHTKAKPAPSKAAKPTAQVSDDLKRAVRKVGPGRYAITKEALMRVLANPATLAKTASVRPLQRDGRTIGMQLVRLRPGSPLPLLGLEKGDVLRHLNGHALSTPDGMLEALRMLRSSREVTLSLLRKDAPSSVSIAIE